MKFQNPSMHSSKLMLCIKKVCNVQWAISHEVFFSFYSKVNQVIYPLIPIYSPGFKALASIAFEVFC